ncbi:MAG TPA: hypothetical protein VF761_13500 [Gemmatimonadaceae bacterium]
MPPAVARAQSIWVPIDHQMHARVEWWHPHLAGASGITALSGARYFSATFPVGERVAFAFELPFARARMPATVTTPAYADASMGNWYVGLQVGDALEPTAVVGEIGARLSATSDDAFLSTTVGMIGDPERFEAFLPSAASLSAAANIIAHRGSTMARLRFGMTALAYSGSGTGDGSHMLIDYGLMASRDIDRLRIAGAVIGRAATLNEGPFGDRASHVATGTASLSLGAFRPSVSLRLPFEQSMRRISPWTLGVGVDITPRGKRC